MGRRIYRTKLTSSLRSVVGFVLYCVAMMVNIALIALISFVILCFQILPAAKLIWRGRLRPEDE